MTQPSTTRRAGPFYGNDATTAFPFDFKVFSTADIALTLTDVTGIDTELVLDSDYSVTLNADQASDPGGTITYPISGDPLAIGETLVAVGALPYDQTFSFPPGGQYRAINHENAFDRTVAQIQQLSELAGRALTLPASAAGADTTLPAPVSNNVIGWNEAANALVNYAPSDIATVVVTGTSYCDVFTPTALQTQFVLTADPGSVNALDVALYGVPQINSVDFTVSGTTLTMAAAPGLPPSADAKLVVRYVAAVPVGSANAQDVAFLQAGAGADTRDAQSKLRERVSVFDYGATGDGITEDAPALAACYAANAGRDIDHGDGKTFLVSAGFTIPAAGLRIFGRSKFKAANGAGIANLFTGTGVSDFVFEGMEIDANKANSGCSYGVYLTGGSRNFVRNAYIHDTRQAGVVLDGESGSFVEGGYILNCGGAAGTDQHGIMLISTGATAQAFGARGVRVASAYRKGITTYTAIGGSLKYVSVTDCKVSGCGVTPSSGGGIYLANQPGATDQSAAIVSGNICFENYVDFEFANVKRVVGSGNVSMNALAQGVAIDACTDAVFDGFSVSDSTGDGILVINSANVALGTVNIRRANRGSSGSGAGLHFSASTYCTVAPGSIIYDETPRQVYAVLEDGASDYNDVLDVTAVGATSALYFKTGANSRFRTRAGAFTGFGAIAPVNTADVDGGLSLRDKVLTLANGANQNAVLPVGSILVSNAPTAIHSIGGLVARGPGDFRILLNYTSFTLTINHLDAGSSAANQIIGPGSANLPIPSAGIALIFYSSIVGKWFAMRIA